MPEAGDQLCSCYRLLCSLRVLALVPVINCSMFYRQYVFPSDHVHHRLVKLFLPHWVESVGVSKFGKLGHNAVMFKFHTWELYDQFIFKNRQKMSNFFRGGKFILIYSLKDCSQQCWGRCDSRRLGKWLVTLQLQPGSRERMKINERMCSNPAQDPAYGMVTPTFRVVFRVSVHLI